MLIAKRLGLRNLLEDRKNKSFKEPWWKRRLQGDIKQLRYICHQCSGSEVEGQIKERMEIPGVSSEVSDKAERFEGSD